MTIPADVMDADFLEQVRRLYLQGDKASKCFQIASQGLADSDRRQYLDQALKHGGAAVRSALLDLIGETEETPLADRARAAVLFLHGLDAGLWTATRQEAEQAGAVILTHYGAAKMPEKTKADPVFANPTRQPRRKTGSADDKSALDLLIQVTTEGELLVRALDHGSPAEKLDAIERWFRIYPVFPADMIRHVNERLSSN